MSGLLPSAGILPFRSETGLEALVTEVRYKSLICTLLLSCFPRCRVTAVGSESGVFYENRR
jgi:hypothetical protein